MSAEIPIPDARSPAPDCRLLPVSIWQRIALAVVGLVLVGLLATAACLPPDPYGLGTHQQLGLPPCTFVVWFNMRCPACGMTTSWAHLMRGQVLHSAQANTGGMLLALVALVGGPWMLATAARGRWWLGQLEPQWLLIGASVVFLVTTVQWLGRLFA